jgi:hypothetical protein
VIVGVPLAHCWQLVQLTFHCEDGSDRFDIFSRQDEEPEAMGSIERGIDSAESWILPIALSV